MSFETSSALALIVALPLLAAISAAAGRPSARGSWIGAAAAVASLAGCLWCASRLYALPEARRCLRLELGPALRIGSLDAGLALELDGHALPLLVAVGAAGALIALSIARAPGEKPGRGELAGQSLLLAGAQAMVLASGFVLTLLAWTSSGVACALLVGRRAPWALERAAQLLLLAGSGVLFWTFGGTWEHGYEPALRPRLVAVDAGPGAAGVPIGASRPGELTLASLPGARVDLGAAQLCAIDADGRRGGIGLSARPCREVAKSPFARLPAPAALHDLHVRPGPGANELVVEKVKIQPGKETALLLIGPALGFRELRQQLTVPGAKEQKLERALAESTLWGLPALALAALLLVASAAFKSDRVPGAWTGAALPASSAAALGALATFGGILLLARLDFVFALAPAVATLGVVYGSASALRSAARALDEGADPIALARVHGGIALAAVSAGAAPAALIYLAAASLLGPIFALAKATARGTTGLILVQLAALGVVMASLYRESTGHVPGVALCVLFVVTELLLARALLRTSARAAGKTVPATKSLLLRWLASPVSSRALADTSSAAVTRAARVLVELERTLYRPARGENER